MSLEDALNRLSDVTEKHNTLLEKVLGTAAAKTAAQSEKPAADDKEKPAGKKAAGKKAAPADEGFDLEAAIKKAGAWLGEFKANEKDPETDARKAKFRAALDKLGYKTAKEIDKPEDVERFSNWIDKQIAAGRITEEPTEDDDAAAGGDDDDI